MPEPGETVTNAGLISQTSGQDSVTAILGMGSLIIDNLLGARIEAGLPLDQGTAGIRVGDAIQFSPDASGVLRLNNAALIIVGSRGLLSLRDATNLDGVSEVNVNNTGTILSTSDPCVDLR